MRNYLDSVVRHVLPATVYIHCETYDDGVLTHEAMGSGIILREDGIIITNQHVIDRVDAVHVELHDGRRFPATVLGGSRLCDVAVLKINAPAPLPTVTPADMRTLHTGHTVFAVGMPMDAQLRRTATFGRVSHPRRFGPWENAGPLPMVQVDLTIATGNSGGGLFNSAGAWIGINTAIRGFGETAPSAGYTFSLRADDVVAIAARIIQTGYGPWRRKFGAKLQPVTTGMATAAGLATPSGMAVCSVQAGTLAATQGLQVGDIITHIGAERIDCQEAVAYALLMGEGETLNFAVRRGFQRLQLPLKLPRRYLKRVTKPQPTGFDRWGLRLKDTALGVVVKKVLAGSVAAIEGFGGGEQIKALLDPVTGTWVPVTNVQQLLDLLAHYPQTGAMLQVKTKKGLRLMALPG